MSNSKTYEIPAGTVPSLSGQVAIAVVPVNPTTGDPILGGGGGGGGDTSNIKTNNTTIPTTSALVGGSDGTNIRPVRTDASGNLRAVGTRSDGDAVAGTTFFNIGGSDGTNLRNLRTDTSGRPVVNAQPAPAASVSESAVSITGGAATNAAASNANRMTLTLANPTASIVYWSTGTASASTFPLYPQQVISLTASQIGTGAISVFSASSVTIRALETSR